MTDLLNGDCYEFLKTIPDNSIDLVVTDPPYEFNAKVTGGGMFSDKNAERYGRKSIRMLNNLEKLDSTTFKPSDILDTLKWKMRKFYGYFFCNKTLVPDYLNWSVANKFTYDILVMAKTNPIPAHSTHHCSDLEYIILIRDKGTYFTGSGLEQDCYKKFYQTNCQKRIHPAEKPVELLKRFVQVSSKEGDVILDPFMGSGSTGVACKELNRNFIGIEKDKNYFNIARNRINDLPFITNESETVIVKNRNTLF